MWDKLDWFLATDTWFKSNQQDQDRFYVVLHSLLQEPGFDPERMRDHLLARVELDELGQLSMSIERLVASAHAVRDYLRANRRSIAVE